jgi:hypothetical protein
LTWFICASIFLKMSFNSAQYWVFPLFLCNIKPSMKKKLKHEIKWVVRSGANRVGQRTNKIEHHKQAHLCLHHLMGNIHYLLTKNSQRFSVSSNLVYPYKNFKSNYNAHLIGCTYKKKRNKIIWSNSQGHVQGAWYVI